MIEEKKTLADTLKIGDRIFVSNGNELFNGVVEKITDKRKDIVVNGKTYGTNGNPKETWSRYYLKPLTEENKKKYLIDSSMRLISSTKFKDLPDEIIIQIADLVRKNIKKDLTK